MTAIEPLCHLLKLDTSMLTYRENLLLEGELFALVCEELKEIFREQYRDYFRFIKLTREKENLMLESRFAEFIINDIVSTGQYTTKGIAYYTDTFEEVVVEIMTGLNTSPSAIFLRKLIELHHSVRRELYDFIIKKVMKKLEN